MTDDRKISEYKFSEMNFSFVNIINLTTNYTYLEGHFRLGAKIIPMFKVEEENGKVKIF
jgi:hypothetical protein